MICREASLESEQREALEFLHRRPLMGGVYLLGPVRRWSPADPGQPLLLARRREELVAVGWLNACGTPAFELIGWVTAVDGPTAEALLRQLLPGRRLYLRLPDPAVQAHVAALPGAREERTDWYYTAEPADFRPADGPAVVELGAADGPALAGCESVVPLALSRLGRDGLQAWAVLHEGRVAASVLSQPLWSPPCPWAGIAGLVTETACRRRGWGRRLVSVVTERILAAERQPVYYTDPSNQASQRLVGGLGYHQFGTVIDYTWTVPG